jgi:hypothetical protein
MVTRAIAVVVMVFEMLRFALMFFIPHFLTEDVGYYIRPDGKLELIAPIDHLPEDIDYDGVVSCKSLVWLFWGHAFSFSNFRE